MAVPNPGQKFEEKYLIEEHIGSGGFAEVFKATGPDGRAVAIKILVPVQAQWAQNDPIVERFEREGQLLGKLTNEHTVRMIEMGRTSDGSPFIVFEYVKGEDLASVIENKGALPAHQVQRILQQVCSALQEAHNLGVMHRDIKPANIMIYEHMGMAGLVKLLDFGIAKPTEGMGSDADLTSAGMVLGTPRYMAPEQFTGARAAPTSDIYSLGLVAFELITGRLAVDAQTTTGIFRQQLSPDEFKIPRTAQMPAGLRRVIEKMTRKTRHERYQNVDEVLYDLANLDRVSAPASRAQNNKLKGILIALLLAISGLAVVATVLAKKVMTSDDEAANVIPDAPPQVAAVKVEQPDPDPVAQPDPEPDEPQVEEPPDEPPQVEEPPDEPEPDEPEPDEPEPDEIVVPTSDTGERLPPPPDDIEPLELGSAAAAKNVATRALTMGDWDKVIAACKPYGEELTFCARWLADAYRSRGNIDQACYWFETVNAEKTGLNCPYEERRRTERMNKRMGK